jgi:alpha-amylase/alpha-mannosidase (GH57 family)
MRKRPETLTEQGKASMSDRHIAHALGLHMHQPPGNLRLLIDTDPWEAEQIMRCYDRVPRYALAFRDVARLHVGFSGILLEQLRDPDIVDRYRHLVDIPAMLDAYRQADNIELVGMGYYHPVFPLIPPRDWRVQLEAGRDMVEDTFGRVPRGFWPPELAFCMELIPALARAGYEYVVVDGVHVRPEDGVDDIYRPSLACHEGACITVVPRDRVISNAQESGLDPDWFLREALSRTAASPRPGQPRLLTTWSDGENGGWFRQIQESSGFFGHFFAPYMERARARSEPVEPICICDYLARHGAAGQSRVQTGAWNVGSTSGFDFSRWCGSEGQRRAVQALEQASSRLQWLETRAGPDHSRVGPGLERARSLILEGETSCFLFWGDVWLPQLYQRIEPAQRLLDQVQAALDANGRMSA